MFWFFAATHASHYYLTITMQNYLRFPLQMCGVLRLCVVGGGTNKVNPPRRPQKFIMTNIMCSTLCHSNRGDAFNPPKNIIRREIFAKRPPKKNSFFRAAIKKKLIILYSSTVNPIRLHTVINFTFLNFPSIVKASLDNSNLINCIWSESIHELQVCLRRIT